MEKNWYDKSYKFFLLIPVALLIVSIGYLWSFQNQHGDIIYKDVTLTGGTTITVFDGSVGLDEVRSALSDQFPDISLRGISDFRTGEQKGFLLETKADVQEIRPALESFLGYELTQENSSIEFSGATLSQGFYHQLRLAIFLAFIFMAIVVFIIFRTIVPSTAVILAAFSDIVMTIAVVNLIGMPLSTAGIVAFLLLIGYSVDTDILLTTRMLKKREGEINERLFGALKTGVTMTLTSIVAISVSLFVIYNSSEILRQMFTILLIGLGFDLFNTWFANASILKWYVERREGGR
ncbi:MAG: protein translocase subunit SecF [Nanoarchaeota archaeon]